MIPLALATAVVCGGPALLAWQAGVLAAVIWLPAVLYGITIMYGTTRLTPEGLHLRSLFRRSFVPWARTGMVEAQERTAKASTYQVAVVHIEGHRRPRYLPGLRSDGTPALEADFTAALRRIRDYQRRAVRQL
ncbi:hypothetical protein CFP65_2822 [Kitasatospora sp. MMS16-BH015]|uniref:PH domain-containing protein n=1 Tax=Kitasatospora sp. MMS16-BH015 TaxID=2018025 RepID=UPI000CA1A409|nr:PH domain-containing protein [Kitasatospora sp. MMS16-BH015]AUG77638.1 hypothetical protein CFP65_2822 [Kitasatospora sp. MMS16-BH015]